ncbi:MAG: helix-turn-helix transcriptional regulator [Acidobacteria bacterium]|nr:helix-turn-helix transcriptional regulator [Acidobacteriota bacterium]
MFSGYQSCRVSQRVAASALAVTPNQSRPDLRPGRGRAEGAGRRNPHRRRRQVDPGQRQVLHLLAEGCTAKEVAVRLSISIRFVEFHKYQVTSSRGPASIRDQS